MAHTSSEKGGSRAAGGYPGPSAPPYLPSQTQPLPEPEDWPGGAERPSSLPERPGYERRPHVRFFAIYGLLVGIVTTCVALLFALVIDTTPDLNGRPDTTVPTAWPSGVPTDLPTELPSDFPTDWMTAVPTELPTGFPTDFPTELPSDFPTDWMTAVPTELPTGFPTNFPTDEWPLPTDLFGESLEAP
ncbi:hypothetical protein [Streptomyces sp. NPDC006510]|uniref:hypothetical protein n=1 Tax=Streptomyces sp. NPDC006510 TaxID=3155600 RepID=UPI0033A0C579